MLTLEQWGGPTIKPLPTQPYLLRFEHIYENGEDVILSKPANITLQVKCEHNDFLDEQSTKSIYKD